MTGLSKPGRDAFGGVKAGTASALDLVASTVRPLFQFARPTQLRKVFEPSSRGGALVLNELDPVVRLMHPAVAPGENGAGLRNFRLDGAAGTGLADLSETPAGLIQYYQFFAMTHDDGATPQRMLLILADNRSGQNMIVMDTAQMTDRFPVGTVSSAVSAYFDRGPIVVPEGCFLRAQAVTGIGAGNIVIARGNVRVQSTAEISPPLF